MNFYLVGFMGVGKTYFGKKWASELGMQFIDLDDLVISHENKSVKEIFAAYGEERFREIESEVLRATNSLQNSIIACGGGTPCFADNISWMNEHGVTIWLKQTPENIAQNLQGEEKARPLLAGINENKMVNFITNLLQKREAFYRQATYHIDLSGHNENNIPPIFTSYA